MQDTEMDTTARQTRSEQASSETIVFFFFFSDSVHLMNRIEYS